MVFIYGVIGSMIWDMENGNGGSMLMAVEGCLVMPLVIVDRIVMADEECLVML